jgi:hypothetical protein
MEKTNSTHEEPLKWEKKVSVRKSGYFTALIMSVVLAALLALFGLVIEVLTIFTIEQRIIFWAILALLFAIFMPLLIPTREVRIIKLVGKQETVHETVTEVEKPVTQIVEVEKPVEVIKYRNKIVEKPVIKYREKKRKKLNIPKYDFLGSNETMTYHKHGCRFSKLIKPKHKLSNNNENFFKRAGFEPCKMCMPEEKKNSKKKGKK